MPGRGPQGGILVGLLYNLYSNRTTGPCEPGVNLQTRFLQGNHRVAEIPRECKLKFDHPPKLLVPTYGPPPPSLPPQDQTQPTTPNVQLERNAQGGDGVNDHVPIFIDNDFHFTRETKAQMPPCIRY